MMFDVARGWLIAGSAGLSANWGFHFIAQSLPGISDNALMQLLEKGGGWTVLVVVLIFYRRDWMRLTESESSMRKELTLVLEKKVAADERLAVALERVSSLQRTLLAKLNGYEFDESVDR